MKILISITVFLFIGLFCSAQEKFIRGHIVDTDNKFVPNATITLKGTNIKIKSDENGSFRIQYNSQRDTLIVSNLGFITLEKAISDLSDNMPLKLIHSTTDLEQVNISTGYQILSRERTSGSFERIGSKSLNERVGSDIISRLEGVSNIAFDRVSSRPAITIRGMGSIEGSSNPLIVVDNFPYEGDIKNINPNDVDDVTILKDAAAASIWGTRAGNGVIVITTKKGKLGRPLRFDFNSNFSIIEKPDLNYIKLISSSDLVGFETGLFSKGFYTDRENSEARPPLSKVIEILIANRENKITENDAADNLRLFGQLDNREDFERYLYRSGFNQQYSLSATGGTDNITYLFSTGLDKNRNELDAGYDKLNLRAVTTIFPFKDFELMGSITYTQSMIKSGRPSYGRIPGLMPYDKLVDENGNPSSIDMYRRGFTDVAEANGLLDWKYYPFNDFKHNFSQTSVQSLLANLSGRYKIVDGLTFDIKYQYERQNSNTKNTQDKDSFYARDLINKFTQINAGGIMKVVPNGGIIDRRYQEMSVQNLRGQINYDRIWARHNFNFIAGAELRDIKSLNNSNRLYGYDSDILTVGNVDNFNSYPNYITKNKEFIPSNIALSEDNNHYLSQYANFAYTYNSKYTLTASARRDASNLFGVKTNEKWQPLWSTGLVWDIASEKFYKFDFVPQLRLRVTYGVSGNVDQSRSAVTTLRYSGLPADYTNFTNATIIQYANPSLKWEKMGQFNMGLDFTLKNSVVNGSIDYYKKNGSDLFGPSPVDITTGIGSTYLTKNVADMKGEGLEVTLRSTILNSSLKWNSGLFFNYNINKVTEYYRTDLAASNYISNGLIVSPLKNRPIYSILSYDWAGLDSQGNPQGFLNGEKSIDYLAIASAPLESLKYNGSATPTIFGSFNNSISWKSITISASISYKYNYSFRRSSVDYAELTAMNFSQGSADYAKRWINPGDEQHTSVPSFRYPNNSTRSSFYRNSSILVERADHIRLQYVNLTYDFSKKSSAKRSQNIQLYINASNLGIIWRKNKYDLDPDYNSNVIPPNKTLSVGIRAGI